MKQIDEEKLQTLWNQYYSIQELADEFQCSTAVIRRVLRKLDIPCDRSTMMHRHFQKHQDELWVDIKRSLDEGLSIHAVSKMYHVAMKTIQKLIEEHQYYYHYERDSVLDHSNISKEILEDMRKQYTVKEIAGMFDVSETVIYRYLKEFELTKSNDRSDIKDEDVLTDWKNGLSITDIAKKYQTSHDTISKRLKKHGITRRNEESK